MEIINDKGKIKKIIAMNGHAAEHNYNHFLNIGQIYDSTSFVASGNKGIMSYMDGTDMWCYSDPLAPKEERLKMFIEFLQWAFDNGSKKVRAEVSEDLWKKITEAVKSGYRCIKPSYIYQWPIFDLKKWDPLLSGSHFKSLRNAKNSFYKEHKVEVIDARKLKKEGIRRFIGKWKKMRGGTDKTHTEHYMSAVESGFEGYDSTRAIIVDGNIGAITGGWKVLHSNDFYSQLGLINYEMKGVGDIAYIEDLNFLKNAGYAHADFGGSTPEMMSFKNKFLPSSVYKTVEFSIKKK